MWCKIRSLTSVPDPLEAQMKPIRQVMCLKPVSVRHETTVEATIEFMTQHRVDGVLVVNGTGHLVGFISELALIDVLFDEAVRHESVSKYMATDVRTIHPEERLNKAAQLFALHNLRHLPVVEDGKLVGILSCRDLLNHALQTGEELADPLVELIPSLAQLS